MLTKATVENTYGCSSSSRGAPVEGESHWCGQGEEERAK